MAEAGGEVRLVEGGVEVVDKDDRVAGSGLEGVTGLGFGETKSRSVWVSFIELGLFLANLLWNFFTSDSSFDLLIFNVDSSDFKFLIVSRAFSPCLLRSCISLSFNLFD